MTTRITGKVYDTIVSVGPKETLELSNLHVTNTHDHPIRLHLDYKESGPRRKLGYGPIDQEVTPQGNTFEQQWER